MHAVFPRWPQRAGVPSGGDRYNARVCHELSLRGWAIRRHSVEGAWPWPDLAARHRLAELLDAIPAGEAVLADGIVVSPAAAEVAERAGRLDLVVLVHLPLGEQFPGHEVAGGAESERRVLMAARAVITTSRWTRSLLIDRYALAPAAVHAVPPGVDRADPARPSATGARLLCVGALSAHKGQDVLLAALGMLGERRWRCRLVGPPAERGFASGLQAAADRSLRGRVEFAGALQGDALGAAYADADLLVVPSLAETYGMVVTEALARGIPVVASDVGGIPEALGRVGGGGVPGALVPPGDADGLAATLRRWLDDDQVRGEWRRRALARRALLAGWEQTADGTAAVVGGSGGERTRTATGAPP